MSTPADRARSALRALFLGDALAMPVHWFYNVADIDRAFPGGIRRLEAPPARHPSSIMSLHSTAGGGRRGAGAGGQPEVVGEIILKEKKAFWNRPNVHYHQGMQAGDNTLNAYCTLALMRSMRSAGGRYSRAAFLDHYVALMTADPPQHPDTYAESFHRGFFANLALGKPPEHCAAVTHDTPSIGGLVMIAPIVFAERLAGTALDQVQALCRQHLFLTHPDDALAAVCERYVTLLDRWLSAANVETMREDLLDACLGLPRRELATLIGGERTDRDVIGGRLSSACYISDAWPAVLYLAGRHGERPLDALLANTNVGGDNAHRGAVLGVLMGLLHGDFADDLFTRLRIHETIDQHVAELLHGR